MARNPLQKLRAGDKIRVVIRFPGPGRLVEVTRVEGYVSGFVHADETVREFPGRTATAGIVVRGDGEPQVFVPGRDLVEMLGGTAA